MTVLPMLRAGLALVAGALESRPSRRRDRGADGATTVAGGSPAEAVAPADGIGTADEAADAASGVLTLSLVRRRLAAVSDELERLDTDHDVFAKAFRTMVARSALQALTADAARLAAAVASLDLERRFAGAVDLDLDVNLTPSSAKRREVLEL